MRKVFTGTIFKDLTNILKQIQVASPHWGRRIVWHLALADAVDSLRRISCSNKKLGNYWEPSMDASGKTELAVEPSGIVLGLISTNNFLPEISTWWGRWQSCCHRTPNSTVFTQTFWPCLQLISKNKSAPDVCLLWYQPSVLCTWELPIWSTRSMKTKPRTRDTPMQAWSCSWLCSCFPPAPRADSTSPLVSDTSTTPAWPWLWCPPAGTRGRREKKEAVQNYACVCWPCLAPSQIPVASPEKQLIYRRTQNKYFCLTKLVTQEKGTSLGCLLRAELRSVWRGFKLLQSTQADIFIHTVCLHALYLDP